MILDKAVVTFDAAGKIILQVTGRSGQVMTFYFTAEALRSLRLTLEGHDAPAPEAVVRSWKDR